MGEEPADVIAMPLVEGCGPLKGKAVARPRLPSYPWRMTGARVAAGAVQQGNPMAFAKSVWRLLVGVKDALVLVLLLLFFFALYGVLTARPSPAQVTEGALLVELNGYVVEEKTPVDPFDALLSGTAPVGEYDVQDVVHALDTAATDERISSVVLDLSGFLGGGQAHLQDIGAALDRVRAAEKPVLTYAVAYADDGMMLASHASEVWLDPLGGAFIAGPGGERLYYAGLLEQLNINARVYRVGTYKSAVEPYLETGMSEPARENYTALYEALWEEWQAHVKKARPRTDIARVTADPAAWVEASSGDLATAALQAGLVDKLGNKVEFGQRVAEISGEDPYGDAPGSYAYSELDPWLADNPRDTGGSAIGVVTIAGEIVDGEAGPGTAGGDRIAALLDDALEDDLAGLVVRVDSWASVSPANRSGGDPGTRCATFPSRSAWRMSPPAAATGSRPPTASLSRRRLPARSVSSPSSPLSKTAPNMASLRTGCAPRRASDSGPGRRLHAGGRFDPAKLHQRWLHRFHPAGRHLAQFVGRAGRPHRPGPRMGRRHGAADRPRRPVWRPGRSRRMGRRAGGRYR